MRPETIADLTEEQRAGDEIFRIYMGSLPADGSLITAVGKLIRQTKAMATTTGSVRVVRSKYGDVVGQLVPSDDELEKKLKSAQAQWDHYDRQYDVSLTDGTKPDTPYGLEQWCRQEGRALPWEADR